jgi:26S proteasome regulatory subunit N3
VGAKAFRTQVLKL